MTRQRFVFMIAFVAASVPAGAAAQHEAHPPAASSSAVVGECVRVQPVVQNIIAAAAARLESARQSNSPADMRAAIESFDAVLRDIRTQLAPCASAAAAPHAGHTMPGTQPAAAAGAPTVKAPAVADPHAGHGPEPQAGKQTDPVNGLMVDPATSPNTTYQGQTYYFSSEASRKEFLANPAKFARKPKG